MSYMAMLSGVWKETVEDKDDMSRTKAIVADVVKMARARVEEEFDETLGIDAL